MKTFLTLLMTVLLAVQAYAWDNVQVQTSDGNAVSSSNPIPVTFGTGNQVIDGTLYADNLIVEQSIYTLGATSSISGASTIAISPGISIAGTGNSGFGTSTPSAMLDVGGGTLTNIDGVNDLLVKDAVEVDGNIYVDTSIYAIGAKSTTGFRSLCIMSDGKLFSVVPPNTCGAGT